MKNTNIFKVIVDGKVLDKKQIKKEFTKRFKDTNITIDSDTFDTIKNIFFPKKDDKPKESEGVEIKEIEEDEYEWKENQGAEITPFPDEFQKSLTTFLNSGGAKLPTPWDVAVYFGKTKEELMNIIYPDPKGKHYIEGHSRMFQEIWEGYIATYEKRAEMVEKEWNDFYEVIETDKKIRNSILYILNNYNNSDYNLNQILNTHLLKIDTSIDNDKIKQLELKNEVHRLLNYKEEEAMEEIALDVVIGEESIDDALRKHLKEKVEKLLS